MKKKQNQAFKFYFFIGLFAGYFLICYCFKLFVSRFTLMNISFQNPFFEFYLAKNTGAAFSILNNNNNLLAFFATVVSIGIVCFVVKNLKNLSNLELHAFAFLFSGVFSNLLERLVDGYVTDYVKLKFVDFPIFNFADLFINIGVILILISLLFKKESKEVDNE